MEVCIPGIGVFDRELGDLSDMFVVDFDSEGFFFEAVATAIVAGCYVLEFFDFLAGPRTIGFTPAAFQIWDHAFKGFLGFVRAHTVII